MVVNLESEFVREAQNNMIDKIESFKPIKKNALSFNIYPKERVNFESIKDELERNHLNYIIDELREKGLIGLDGSLEDLEVEACEMGIGGSMIIILTYSKKGNL
jgi:hypothetical protein